MSTANYHIYGLGSGADDLYYIGWSEKSPNKEQQDIYADLSGSRRNDIACWVRQHVDSGKIDIFEIETAGSPEDARESALFWVGYYRWLGLEVVSDHA